MSGRVFLNGREFVTKESLMGDAEFQSLDRLTQSVLLNALDPNEPIVGEQGVAGNDVVSMAQFRKALILNGVDLNAIDAFIKTLPSPQKELVLADWEYSSEVKMDCEWLSQIATAVGLDCDGMKRVFELAKTL